MPRFYDFCMSLEILLCLHETKDVEENVEKDILEDIQKDIQEDNQKDV